MGDRRDALGLEIRDRLDDFVAQLNSADALVALLNPGGLAVYLDLEPDAADACGLHREIAGLAGDAGVRPIAADHRIERAVTADFLIDDHVDVDVALRVSERSVDGEFVLLLVDGQRLEGVFRHNVR